jgi:hypothetical protein
MYEYYFKTKRKPSNAQVLKKINEAINKGYNYIEVSWGENMITIERMNNRFWHGSGWIRNISGADLAVKINEAIADQFKRDHFQFIRVGF